MGGDKRHLWFGWLMFEKSVIIKRPAARKAHLRAAPPRTEIAIVSLLGYHRSTVAATCGSGIVVLSLGLTPSGQVRERACSVAGLPIPEKACGADSPAIRVENVCSVAAPDQTETRSSRA